MKVFLGLLGLSAVFSSGAFAGVERKIRITDDSKLYQRLRETRVRPAAELAFESDIARLEAMEGQYNERLASHPRLRGSVGRISKLKYRR